MNKEEGNYIIYKAQNEFTGESYVGATTNSIEQRKLDHQERANRGELNKFHEAISTYGAEAFTWQQVDTANSIDELAQKEKAYILQYDSKESGYNSDAGGGFKKTVYQYDIETGKLVDQYECLEDAGKQINVTKQHISRACLSVNNIYEGFYWSYEYMEPFTPKKDARKKEVLKCSMDGKVLTKYNSVSEASKENNLSKTSISRVCRGERESSGGYIWKYN
jgi:hypothetical protein